MGVPGLWKVRATFSVSTLLTIVLQILDPAGESRCLASMTVMDGFDGNTSQKRAYRLGIDVSLWYVQAESGKRDENPILDNLFCKCNYLANFPILPLFVFEGRNRPKVKRSRCVVL